MEGRVICAFSYRLLERQRGREQRREGGERERERDEEWVGADKDGNRDRGGKEGEDERWMVDTKLS